MAHMAKKNLATIGSPAHETEVFEQDRIRRPKFYTVILHNDDFTTQEFVVHILVTFFQKNQEDALQLMLKVHSEGKAKVGKFTKDIAESKVSLITSYSRQNGMPLRLTVEPIYSG